MLWFTPPSKLLGTSFCWSVGQFSSNPPLGQLTFNWDHRKTYIVSLTAHFYISSTQNPSPHPVIMKSMFVLMAFFAMATATVQLEEPEERFLVTNSGGTYLATNATLLWTAVLGAFALIAVFAVVSSGAIPLAAQKYKRYGQQFAQDHFYEDPTQYQTRYKRFAANGNVQSLYLFEFSFLFFIDFKKISETRFRLFEMYVSNNLILC